MEQKNGQTEQGTAMPDRSDLERKRQMHNALCVKYAAAYCCDLLLRAEKRKKCRLRWEVYNLVVYYFRWLVLHYVTTIFQYHRWYQNLRAAGGLQWSGRHGGNAYE